MVWYCVRLLRERGVTPTAWRLYRYSLLYLALLFVAMAVDRNLPGAAPRPDRVMILSNPESAAAASHHHPAAE
jgi:protoheme IX farnesyltransferase